MRYALVMDDDPVLYANLLHRTLNQVVPKPDCILTVSGLQNAERKKRYLHAVLAIFGPRFIAKTLARYVSSPFWTLKQVATHHQVPYFSCAGVNEPGFRSCLQSREVPVVLSVTAQIYRREILALPGTTFYNFHGSLLPGNKGLLPLFWAYMNDAPQGITLHRINETIDDGAIVFHELLEGTEGKDVPAVTDVLLERFPSHLKRAIHHIEQNLAPAYVDADLPASYGPIPSKDDIRAYFRKLKQARG